MRYTWKSYAQTITRHLWPLLYSFKATLTGAQHACVCFRQEIFLCGLQLFREALLAEGFQEIHTPKLIAGASEGGAAVFRLDYMGREGCLAQSPQFYKQMAICSDMSRVFELGPVFRCSPSPPALISAFLGTAAEHDNPKCRSSNKERASFPVIIWVRQQSSNGRLIMMFAWCICNQRMSSMTQMECNIPL